MSEKVSRKKVVEATCEGPCPIERGMRMIGGKWTGSILWHLKDGPVRFNDLSRLLSGASKKMVTQRRKEREERKIVLLKVISTQPIAVSYEITDFGRTALSILEDLMNWVVQNDL